ncbi:pyridoxamine 5'-phosphate oxidase family protein [Paludisphaera mucosa]|uniref:Pyridoxamine 5'-phosphate oxidase family protein n=1 Tax=Paludisphaera mucosa TaxID=3030827 RepID=A0ABT6FKA8_9BACT|nr:pyridoxamine 5'-phosphate oxidase family protein [Paludisphaera mucosa]MDG3007985.1 pyridoxamine 5'-phosphate oxidase family protein [Paludisphaera mucosa]
MDNTRPDPEIRKVGMMIRGIKVAMLTSVAPDGGLHSRPMATQEADFDGTLWFFTRASSGKVEEIRHDSDVNVSYASPDDHRYISLSGRASIVRDAEKIRELWNPSYRIWFAQGLEDPDLALLRVDVRIAQYWDMLVGGMVVMPSFDTDAVEMAVEA